MKKTNPGKKLSLSKKTIASLSDNQSSNIKGGFTYALSMGARCKQSHADRLIFKEATFDFTNNPYECGVANIDM